VPSCVSVTLDSNKLGLKNCVPDNLLTIAVEAGYYDLSHFNKEIRQYEHLWKWDTRLPMWSSIEDEDPWAGGSKQYPAVGFTEKFIQTHHQKGTLE
jgi:hypothetical protein